VYENEQLKTGKRSVMEMILVQQEINEIGLRGIGTLASLIRVLGFGLIKKEKNQVT
jgi:hypothetical protein